MKSYFYLKNDEQIGPVEIEELRQLIQNNTIGKETYLWQEDLPDWKLAKEFPELSNYLLSPPPAPAKEKIQKKKTKSKGKRVLSYIIVPAVLILGVLFFNSVQYTNYHPTKSHEVISPKDYLRVDNLDHKVKLIKNQVKGTVTNTSNHTTFGEIQLELRWYDKKDNLIATKGHTINQNIRPSNSLSFKIKGNSPLKGRSYDVVVVTATPINQD